jgi:hypothetical protein
MLCKAGGGWAKDGPPLFPLVGGGLAGDGGTTGHRGGSRRRPRRCRARRLPNWLAADRRRNIISNPSIATFRPVSIISSRFRSGRNRRRSSSFLSIASHPPWAAERPPRKRGRARLRRLEPRRFFRIKKHTKPLTPSGDGPWPRLRGVGVFFCSTDIGGTVFLDAPGGASERKCFAREFDAGDGDSVTTRRAQQSAPYFRVQRNQTGRWTLLPSRPHWGSRS